jgi:hypothetical protein
MAGGLELGRKPDIEFITAVFVERNVASIVCKNIGKLRRKSVIRDSPVQRVEAQYRGVVQTCHAKRSERDVIAIDKK